MKVVAVTLLVLVLVELGIAQLRPDVNENDLHVRHLQNCNANGINGQAIIARMGPCFDSCTCKLPKCCGIISGRDSKFILEYTAAANLTGGKFNGNLGAISVANILDCSDENRDLLPVDLPFQVIVPTVIPRYSQQLCERPGNQTACPQVAGQNYTLQVPFNFITDILTTTEAVKVTFVAEIVDENGKTVLCWGLWATLANIDLFNSTLKLVGDALKDPIGTVTKGNIELLTGLPIFGTNNPNPYRTKMTKK